jgi:4-aminobutyrate aminotransferase
VSVHDELHARHKKVAPKWQALYYEHPISLVRGEGRHVEDAEGNRYLDFFGGILTTSTGYNVPEVVEAIQQQAGRMLHSSTLYLIESQVELAETIAELTDVPNPKVFFATSGTEANELALLLATLERRSNQVLALRNSYHGRSFGAMAVTGNRGWRASALSPFNVSYVENGYRYRSPYRHLDDAAYIEACVADLRSVINTTTSGDIACFIAEPIQGVGGFATPPDGLFGAMKEVLDEHGILFISDEVQTGWGRTGDGFWGIQAHGVKPDILTFAKGIGNGLTIGGVVASAHLMDGISTGSISTFGGNPLSTTGSLANLRYMLKHNLQENSRVQGGHIIGRLREAQASGAYPVIGDVRGKGLMFAVELVQPDTDVADAAFAGAVMEAARERGLLIGKGGLFGNTLRMAPPMTLTAEEADEGVGLLLEAIGAVQQERHGIATPVAQGAHA